MKPTLSTATRAPLFRPSTESGLPLNFQIAASALRARRHIRQQRLLEAVTILQDGPKLAAVMIAERARVVRVR